MLSDITEVGSSQQSITDGMDHYISIAVPDGAGTVAIPVVPEVC